MVWRTEIRMEHYLDNSATTMVLKESAQKAMFLMTEEFGNPSSLHTRGFKAKCELENAREIIAKSISAKPLEIYFTSGGTEANNLAVFGAANALKRRGNRIVTTLLEHSSVLEPILELEKQGFEVIRLKPDEQGQISTESIKNAIDGKTVLVSMMLVNNEVGSVLPVKTAAEVIRRKKSPALLHTDAVQAYMKMPVSAVQLGADLITISGHKVHAPKGVGALYVSQKVRILPTVFGGGQESKVRSGTEALPLIAAFAQSVALCSDIKQNLEKTEKINLVLRQKLEDIENVEINSPNGGLSYILNFSCGKIKAETMLHYLASKNIYVSSGSACGKGKPSHVLTAMDLPKQRIESAIRASFSRFTTQEDVLALATAIKEGINTLHHE